MAVLGIDLDIDALDYLQVLALSGRGKGCLMREDDSMVGGPFFLAFALRWRLDDGQKGFMKIGLAGLIEQFMHAASSALFCSTGASPSCLLRAQQILLAI